MCVAVLALGHFPEFPLVLAHNRDEWLARPSSPAAWWAEAPEVLGGRDLTAGGSWLAMTRGGRLALVTNIRDLRRGTREGKSRGELVKAFVTSTASPTEFATRLAAEASAYNPFNLVVLDRSEAVFLSGDERRVVPLGTGIHTLSNGPLAPEWPKMRKLREAVAALPLTTSAAELESKLAAALADRTIAEVAELPDTGLDTGRELALSAVNVTLIPGYGTRASTTVLVDASGKVRFRELGEEGERRAAW